MHLLVCGDREWISSDDRDLVFLVLDLTKAGIDQLTIIEGECHGVDAWAREWAIARKVDYLPFPADWSQGNGGGPRRNLKMLQEGRPDLVFAFHDNINMSKGTKNMITLAKKKNIPITLWTRDQIRRIQITGKI